MGELARRLALAPDSASVELDALLAGASAAEPGVLHVCSCVEGPGGRLAAIRIGPQAPAGEHDAFVLRAARAQADAIVTTGSILRHEPRLTHALGDDPAGRALARYRESGLDKRRPPLTLVLSHSGELPASHPLWHEAGPTCVWTAPDHVKRLRGALPVGVEVVAAPGQGAVAIVAWLRGRGLSRISLETGPRAVAPFYEAGCVDELWCGRFLEGARLPHEAWGAAWPFGAAQVAAWRAGEPQDREEPSGRWRFERCLPARP